MAALELLAGVGYGHPSPQAADRGLMSLSADIGLQAADMLAAFLARHAPHNSFSPHRPLDSE